MSLLIRLHRSYLNLHFNLILRNLQYNIKDPLLIFKDFNSLLRDLEKAIQTIDNRMVKVLTIHQDSNGRVITS